jgi:hypothetical protein
MKKSPPLPIGVVKTGGGDQIFATIPDNFAGSDCMKTVVVRRDDRDWFVNIQFK